MAERPAGTENPPGYDELPEFAKTAVSPKEYAWLGSAARARLIQDLTEPDWEEP